MTLFSPTIIFFGHAGRGWGPIDRMVYLMSELLDAPLELPTLSRKSRLRHLRRHLFLAPRVSSVVGAIYIAKAPQEIVSFISLPEFDRPHGFRVLWIVDSFWTEHAPSQRMFAHFDLVIYMQRGEASFYEKMAPGRSLYLGWGADVLEFGSAGEERDIDVLRVGRQPIDWDDDQRSNEMCQKAGLRFHGRPPFISDDPADPSAGQRALMGYYRRSKFLIAHSNLAAPAPYTHPNKEYLTGRWTDALAAGAIVAGVTPYGDAGADDLLWPGATLDFDQINLQDNIAQLAEANTGWTFDHAKKNHKEALMRLDWRWRFLKMANWLDLPAPKLRLEIERLENAIQRASV